MPSTNESLTKMMRLALEQASLASSNGEIPVGAIITVGEKVIAKSHNLVETLHDASAHAEILAIKEASQFLKNWRLNDTTLYVTLEPCPMCIGAIRLARISTIVFGVRDPRMGAVGSLFDLGRDSRLGNEPRIIEGICENECEVILKEFFKKIRGQKSFN